MSSSSTAAVAKRLERPGVPASSKLFQSAAQRTLLLCLLLTAAVLVVYNPVIHNGFLNFDDDGYITANAHVKAGLTWATVKWAFTTYNQGNWHPLTWLSPRSRLSTFRPESCRTTLRECLAACGQRCPSFSTAPERHRIPLAQPDGCRIVCASVRIKRKMPLAWAAERKNVLSMMFFLLALYAYNVVRA